jgi:hypothetical protein
LAGFQVILIGRFWVIAEAVGCSGTSLHSNDRRHSASGDFAHRRAFCECVEPLVLASNVPWKWSTGKSVVECCGN